MEAGKEAALLKALKDDAVRDKTLRRLYRHIRKTPEGCWLWQGCSRMMVKKLSFYVTRLSWIVHRGRTNGLAVISTCGNDNCINPAHRKLSSARREYSCKLAPHQLRYIRASHETYAILAKRFGVSTGTIGNAHRGKSK